MIDRLRKLNVRQQIGPLDKPSDEDVLHEWQKRGVKFVASTETFETVYYSALKKLLECIVPTVEQGPILHEGGAYLGCWLESTGTINAEILDRFVPTVAERTFRLFATFLREDGLMPYKITPGGPAFKQIQLVSPLARSVWNHYLRHGRNKDFLKTMYDAMRRYDTWLSTYRNTRKTGCVEAFCTFDTGHDLSPRFWHVPDVPHMNNPTMYNPDSPILPFLAPDLTANVYCQRQYLALMASELDEAQNDWRTLADTSLRALFEHCYDEVDAFFYDLDKHEQFVRVQSDVLLRVLACEVGDDLFFARALQKYLLNTRKFFSKYPFTSIALDDPRYDPSSAYNTWGGTSNFLSLIRSPHAFEFHHRHVELTWVMYPIVTAFSHAQRFGQNVNPWTGKEGYTESYSPAILCLLDFIERLCGIFQTPDGCLWFTGLLPYPLDHGETIADETGYTRWVDGTEYELVNTRTESQVYRNRELYMRFPYGVRVVTDKTGQVTELMGMSARTIYGQLWVNGHEWPIQISGNQRLKVNDGVFTLFADPGVIVPTYA